MIDMIEKLKYFLIILLFFEFTAAFAADKERGRYNTEEPLTKEKLVKVSIKYGNGFIDIGSLDNDNVYEGEFLYKGYKPDVEYEVIGDEGRLDVHFSGDVSERGGDEDSKHLNSLDELYDNEMILHFNKKVPLDFDLDFGVIKGDMDLSSLRIQNIKMEVGVSKSSVFFNEPNKTSMDEFSIEGGVGKLEIDKLGNANVKSFDFEGGIGSYELDFSGNYQQDLAAHIELGMGKMTLYLPENIGTRLKVDKSFLSSFSIDDVYKDGDMYTNDKWGKTKYSLDMSIETGVGKIDVEWVK
jgi:hypothetical protein